MCSTSWRFWEETDFGRDEEIPQELLAAKRPAVTCCQSATVTYFDPLYRHTMLLIPLIVSSKTSFPYRWADDCVSIRWRSNEGIARKWRWICNGCWGSIWEVGSLMRMASLTVTSSDQPFCSWRLNRASLVACVLTLLDPRLFYMNWLDGLTSSPVARCASRHGWVPLRETYDRCTECENSKWIVSVKGFPVCHLLLTIYRSFRVT